MQNEDVSLDLKTINYIYIYRLCVDRVAELV